MVSKICWNCHFFVADDSGSQLGGVCVRHAPKGADFNAFALSDKWSYRFDFGLVNPGGQIYGGGVTPLHLAGAAAAAPSCHATDATGYNANDILPYLLPNGGFRIVRCNVAASLLNSGAGTVGTDPLLHLRPVVISGDSQSQGELIDIPIPPSLVSANGNITDLFVNENIDLGRINPIFPGLMGFRVELSGTGENDISEARNLKIGLTLATQNGVVLDPITSKAKWATLVDASTQYCGEFKPSTETIPPIPTP